MHDVVHYGVEHGVNGRLMESSKPLCGAEAEIPQLKFNDRSVYKKKKQNIGLDAIA